MHSKFTRAAVAAALACGVAAASAAPSNQSLTDIDALRHMAPPQARAWVQQQVKKQEAAQAADALVAIDVRPPALTAFNVEPSVDVTLATNPLSVVFKGTDDLSGVRQGGAYATGPSGQSVDVSFFEQLPGKKLTGVMHTYDQYQQSAFLEPGRYTFWYAFVADAAGRFRNYDKPALAALGNISFTVKNEKGYDAVPPRLQAGKVLTPTVSLSATHPGTHQPPYAGITVDAIDSGNTAVAGVQSITAIFCPLDDATHCLGLYSADSAHEPRRSFTRARLGGQLSATSHVPGEYHLSSVYIRDYGGNSQYLFSTEFGGLTDFSVYFPSTTITVQP